MTPSLDVKEIFGRAIAIVSATERAAYLDDACGDNAACRAEVESLLRAHANLPPGFMAANESTTTDRSSPNEDTGKRIGPYKLLQVIGEGGMGTVFMAEQEQPVRRRVAVKLIKPGMDTAQVVARFEAERQALAMMDHLNIAKVLDAGTTESGLPYFAMELVHGVPITQYCDTNRLTPRERLELFVPVCQAIQHAHTKGIVHRDIKPSNVLVTLYDGRPVPKVIDFGVAKATEQRLTERTMFTQYGATVGTFEYMSPEQAEMSGLGVDTRGDIYSLGVVLYELLTGTTPLARERLQQAGYIEKLRMIKEDEPHRPSTQLSRSDTLQKIAAARKTDPVRLKKIMKGELDWIVMKCLEKDRTRRYETANALARDLQRYLADEPVEACPPSTSYRLRRLARKYRTVLWSIASIALLLVLAVVLSTWLAVRATNAERQMQTERDRTRLALTRQVAERIEGDLWRLEMVGQGMAGLVADKPDWGQNQLSAWMADMLHSDNRIFGLCLAFEPRQFDPNLDYYGLYVFRKKDGVFAAVAQMHARGATPNAETPWALALDCYRLNKLAEEPKGVVTTELLQPDYNYLRRDWYKDGKKGAHWTEPFFDDAAGNIWMVSYASPLRRRGKDGVLEDRPIGVLTVDLNVEYFARLQDWLGDLQFGKNSDAFVLSGKGKILSHTNNRYDLWKRHEARPLGKVKEDPVDATTHPDFAALTKHLLQDGRGMDQKPPFLHAPVGRAKWTFVAVVAR